MYVDPWHDIAFLKSDKIPESAAEAKLSKKMCKLGDDVFIVGKNEGLDFSYQTGTISNKYQLSGLLPSQIYRVSLNAQGGSSGSAVVDSKSGEVIAINHARHGSSSAFSLPIKYVYNALEYISKGKIPPRKSIGAILKYMSLDKLVSHYSYPKNTSDDYLKKFPDSFKNVLVVDFTLSKSVYIVN